MQHPGTSPCTAFAAPCPSLPEPHPRLGGYKAARHEAAHQAHLGLGRGGTPMVCACAAAVSCIGACRQACPHSCSASKHPWQCQPCRPSAPDACVHALLHHELGRFPLAVQARVMCTCSPYPLGGLAARHAWWCSQQTACCVPKPGRAGCPTPAGMHWRRTWCTRMRCCSEPFRRVPCCMRLTLHRQQLVQPCHMGCLRLPLPAQAQPAATASHALLSVPPLYIISCFQKVVMAAGALHASHAPLPS